MRILIHGLNFSPELVGIGKYTGDMARFLAEQGHQVRVVTAPPYYPAWHIQPGYSAWKYSKEILEGLEIIRCPLWTVPNPSGLERILHLASFAFSSMPIMLSQAIWKPNLVIGIAPAIAGAPSTWLTARLSGCPAWLHIQDFELDAAINLKMLPGSNNTREMSFFAKVLQSLEKWLLNRFDKLSTISQSMVELLRKKGVPNNKILLLPNWVDCEKIFPIPGPNQYRAVWGVLPDQIVALYSGSMGQKQGLELLLKAAHQLQEGTAPSSRQKLIFVLCGEGSAREELEQQAKGLNNIHFLPLQPEARLNELLNAADIHVLLQRANVSDKVMPSKLTGILASGRAVVATANPGTELARVVDQVGRLVPAGDLDSLCDALRTLADQAALRQELGMKGRKYALAHWDRQAVLSGLLTQINSLQV